MVPASFEEFTSWGVASPAQCSQGEGCLRCSCWRWVWTSFPRGLVTQMMRAAAFYVY